MKNVLVILGHPIKGSFCEALANQYLDTAKSQSNHVEFMSLNDLNFDPNFKIHFKETKLEDDLKKAQEKIKWADHIVWIYPIWWGDSPALLKGFIDRVFLPGFAFKYKKGGIGYPDKLLTGKTSELIITMDAPIWYYKLFLRSPGLKIMKRDILAFCGIKVTKTHLFGPVISSSIEQRTQWINQLK